VKESDDELGVLVDVFNRMLGQVEFRDRHLEEQVALRTTELTVSNRELTTARDRAEEAARLKSEFLANMSHEIRTPMNVIIGMTQIALDAALEPRQAGYLTMVCASAQSLLVIINDILDFSKIEAGKLDLEPIEFQLSHQLSETTASFSRRAEEKDLDLRLNISRDPPISCWVTRPASIRFSSTSSATRSSSPPTGRSNSPPVRPARPVNTWMFASP
jgi:signal transduction histidine kinase